MNCYLCSDRPKVFCPCSKCFICSNHITQHLGEQGAHSLELIDRIISKSQLNDLQNKLITKIKAIEETKQSILIKITNLCQKIMKQGMSSIKELDLQAQWYLNLSSLSSFSVILVKEVGYIIDTDLNIELLKKELNSKIPDFNYEETNLSSFSEVHESNRILEVCMGCCVYENVFQVSCKHLLCAKCIKSPCKMCGFINADKSRDKYSTIPTNLSERQNKTCFLCKKVCFSTQIRNCTHSVCDECSNNCCSVILSKFTPITRTPINKGSIFGNSLMTPKGSDRVCREFGGEGCEDLYCVLCRPQEKYFKVKKKNSSPSESKSKNNLCKVCKNYNEGNSCKYSSFSTLRTTKKILYN